jgi:hypothetical protein
VKFLPCTSKSEGTRKYLPIKIVRTTIRANHNGRKKCFFTTSLLSGGLAYCMEGREKILLPMVRDHGVVSPEKSCLLFFEFREADFTEIAYTLL